VHRWFKNVDWVALREQRIRPPWVPAAHMKPGHTGCFLTWKTEPEISEKEPPSEQVQGYSRIKLPGGCALRAPQPQNATGKRKGNGSASDNFHRVVLEALANPATGARCSAMQRRSGGVGVGGSAGGGVSGSRGSRDSIVIGGTTNGGSGGGGNAKRRFRSAGCRVVAGAHNLDGQSGRHQKERKSSSTMGGGAGHTNNITTAAVSPRSRG
ncbi:unnamed protein product, partial [Sphacelaria rigidula]